MTIDKNEAGLFIARAQYEDRTKLKDAGFRWHDYRSCRVFACVLCVDSVKAWWTDDAAIVARLETTAAAPEVQAAAEEIAASRLDDADVDVPLPPGLTLLPFQRAGIKYAVDRPNTLIADEMGLGKTIQALGVLNYTAAASVLVVCPATLRLNWQREAERWTTHPWKYHIVGDWSPPPDDADFVIVNYDRLVGPKSDALVSALVARQWDFLILDEAHYIKTRTAKRTKAIMGDGRKKIPGLAKSAKRLMFLTGTPITNRPVELWTLLATLDKPRWKDFWPYANRYCAAKQTKWGWDFNGASNLGELQDRLRSTIMVRRLKKDVLKDLPAKRRQIISVPPNGTAKVIAAEDKVWRKWKDRLGELRAAAEEARAVGDEDGYAAAVHVLNEAKGVAFGEISRVRHETALAKVPYVLEHVDDLLMVTPKIVIFAHHKDVVAAILGHFGAAAVEITGDTPQELRQERVDWFQTQENIRVFVGSITAAGVGITLTASSTVVFAELDWTPANVSQAEDRCHRIGQTDSVLVQHVVIDGSLDARMAKTLVRKQATIDAALDKVHTPMIDPFEDDE